MRSVVIIGAGLSGLSVGAALSKNGYKVNVVEKGGFVGGLARSFTHDGCVFDVGPHIFFGKRLIPRLKEYFAGQDVLVRNTGLKQGIYIRGKAFKYPFQLKELLCRMEKSRLPRVIWDVLRRGKIPSTAGHGKDVSLEQWVQGKIGPALFDYIELNTYVEKLYGIPASQISADWGRQRLKQLDRLTLWQAANRGLNPFARKPRPCMFYSPKGIGGIAVALAEYIRTRGGQITLNAALDRVDVVDEKVHTIHISQGNNRRTVSGDYFVSSIGLTELMKMIRPQRSERACHASSLLRHRALIILYVMVQRPVVLDHCLIYYSTTETTFKRITDFRHFSPELVPEGTTCLAIEICVDPDQGLWEQDERQIFEKIMTELEGMDIVKRGGVTGYFALKVPSAYPVYFVNYIDSLKVIFEDLGKIENLVCLGRHGLYQHDNMPTSIESGFRLADLITAHSPANLEKVSRVIYQWRMHKYDDIA